MLVTSEPDIRHAEGMTLPSRVGGVPPGTPAPVTVMITWNVLAGQERAFEEWAHGITEAGYRYPGHLGSNWFRLGDASHRYRTVIRFASDDALRGWMESDERRDWIRRVEGYTRRSEQRLSGMETWFTLPGTTAPAPPRWKMFLVTVVCSYAVSLTVNLALGDVLAAVPIGVRVLISTVILVGALTWPILPNVTRLLRRFLYPPEDL